MFEVPAFLEHLTGGVEKVEVTGGTVGQCLDDFVSRFPGARHLLLDKSGRLLGHIEIMVNGQSTFPEERARPVRGGDTISMVYLLVGG